MGKFKPIHLLHSQLASYPIRDGQIIYLTDQFGTYIDVSGERVPIEQIKSLTETERQNLLAPVVGFYYETDTRTLWHYDGEWNSFELRPVYSDVSVLETLKSGEKLSVSLSKIKYAITSLIKHIADTSNPHKTNKSQIGLSNVENKSSNTIRNEITKANVTDALGYTPPEQDTTYGIASTDVAGLIKAGGDITVDETGIMTVNDDSHNHVIANVDSLQSALDGKASSSHTHTKAQITDFPISMPASDVKAWAKADNKPAYTPTEVGVIDAAPTSGQVAVFDGTTGKIKSTGYTIASSVPAGAKFTDTIFRHPGHTSYPAKLYIVAVDELGHVSSAREVVKKDITDLGVPEQDTRYNLATATTNGLISAADKSKLDGIAPGANNYTLPVAGAGLGGVKTTSTVINISGYIPAPIVDGVPYYKDTNTTYSAATAAANGLLSAEDYKKLQKFTEAEAERLSGITGNIQTQLNGKAPSSHGTHVNYGTAAPKSPGTASPGSSANVSREDHIHPVQTSVSGNAGSATKLQTPQAINGTSFDGSAPITTANWGTARNVTVGNSKKSVNGSADVSWTLAEIGAASASHNHPISNVSGLQEALDSKAAKDNPPVEITLQAASWTGAEEPYTITVPLAKATATNRIEVMLSAAATKDQAIAFACAAILKGTQAAGSMTLYAYGDKPGIDVPITVIVGGD